MTLIIIDSAALIDTGTCKKTGINDTLLDVLEAIVIPTQIPPGLLGTLTGGSKIHME